MDSLDKMACIILCCLFITCAGAVSVISIFGNKETKPLDIEELEAPVSYQYNNHSYLLFMSQLIHDPDCQYCQEKVSNAIDKYILDHFPTNPIIHDYGCGIMLTDTKPNIPYVHGIPAPRNSNDPPWIHMEYPIAVIEGLTEEERNKWFPINNSNSIIITNLFSASEEDVLSKERQF